MSRFTSETIRSGDEVSDVCARTMPTTWVVHMPAARPLPQISPSATDDAVAGLLDGEESPGQMTHRKNFAGDLEISEAQLPRSTEPPVHLRGLEESPACRSA
jgi:hypothetical protein